MKTFGKTVMAFGMAALFTAPAMAQGGRGFGGGGGGAMLLTNKSVQQELKVTDEQAEKLKGLADGIREKHKDDFSKLQDIPQADRQAKMQEIGREVNAEIHKALPDVLKADQVKRFTQIQVQAGGPNSFSQPRVQEKLTLTDDQKAKIGEINQGLQASMRDLRQSFQNDREGAMKKMTESRKEASDKIHALLTEDQKKAWKELTGDPFEVKFERPAN